MAGGFIELILDRLLMAAAKSLPLIMSGCWACHDNRIVLYAELLLIGYMMAALTSTEGPRFSIEGLTSRASYST